MVMGILDLISLISFSNLSFELIKITSIVEFKNLMFFFLKVAILKNRSFLIVERLITSSLSKKINLILSIFFQLNNLEMSTDSVEKFGRTGDDEIHFVISYVDSKVVYSKVIGLKW